MANTDVDSARIADRVTFFKRKVSALFERAKNLESDLSTNKLNDLDLVELEVHLLRIEQTKSTFNGAHNSLEELDFDEIGSKVRDDFDDLMAKLEARVRVIIQKHQSSAPPHSTFGRYDDTLNQTVIVANRSRLPELKLPTFSDGYTEYANFYAMFESVVDKDPELTNIEKLQHLRSCLSGPALDAVRSLDFIGANYRVALDILNKRFSNKRIVFQAHIKEILGLKRVDNESASHLRQFSDKVNSHMRALKTLGNSEQISGCFIVQTLLEKLDVKTRNKWDDACSSDKVPTADEFFEFLERRCQKLDSIQYSTSANSHMGKSNQNANPRKAFVAETSQGGCGFCDERGHGIYSCSRFANLSPSLRHKEVKKLALCFNCLKKGHQTRSCSSSHCRTCGGKHHSLLHFATSSDSQAVGPASTSSAASIPPSTTAHSATSLAAQGLQSGVVLLATAVVMVRNSVGSLVPCRALLDSGSQLHMVTSRFAQRLHLKKTRSSAVVTGLGDTSVSTDGSVVKIQMKSSTSAYSATFDALVAPTITDSQPSFAIDTSDWKIPSNITLADPAFNKPQRVDLLIGASLFYELLSVGQIMLLPGLPLLQKTRLGWVVTGGFEKHRSTSLLSTGSAHISEAAQLDFRLDDLVRRFWEIESLEEPMVKASKEELECEQHFVKNFSRLPSGEYMVRLPLKPSAELLGDSYDQAYRRFLSIERKLGRHAHLKEQYSAFIKEFLDLNHMSQVAPESIDCCKYFLPHHCVLKEDSTTTKLRVVFDGSASTDSGYSLNDVLMAGPIIQPKLLHILIRFRTYPVALTADICKMYRCVRVAMPDSLYQCILWRDSPAEGIKVFKLDTVTYGTKSASFQSVRAMHQLAIDERDAYPIGSKALQQEFYVDDFISGANSVAEARQKMDQTCAILARGQFKLRKWCSSHEKVLDGVAAENREQFLKFDDGSDVTKALGLVWDPAVDTLLFSFSVLDSIVKPSRRSVLSIVARFYDPLGLLGPVITKAKIFLQQLCKDQLNWDESLPVARDTAWKELCSSFQNIPHVSFPRVVLIADAEVEIHGFCDASLEAYGACVYVVTRGKTVTSRLLCSKSRVAPLKTLSVPKLELCGAKLLASLMYEINRTGIFFSQFYCWCDSSVVLSWIRDEPFKFNVFVANRVSAIQELTLGMQWHHVPTDRNPADILSRGALPEVLAQSDLWFHGPPYLVDGRPSWPASCIPEKPTIELRKSALIVTSPHADLTLGCKHSNSFGSMQRTFGYVYKFIKRIRNPGLTVLDVHHGTRILLRLVQMTNLWDDMKEIRSHGNVRKSSSIAALAPFLDECGLLRVGGRLCNSSLDYDGQHPIILPQRHAITQALIVQVHQRNLHIGPRALLAKIRLQYWPIGGLRTVTKAIRGCVTCFRARPSFVEPMMASLPKERLEAVRAFTVTGVDYCGPFFYKSEVRTRAPLKCYVSVFICFTSKAVHLELVKDLSTAAFLSALKRFIATRGKPSQMWSDNATNFVGAKNELLELKTLMLSDSHLKAVQQFCLADDIDWKFIPPRSPHFGGLWEAAVKLAKHHFYRSVCRSVLHFDELRTLVCQICAVINSRPLLALSENPADLDVLTPAHLLFGGPPSCIIEPDLTKLNYNRLDGWQRVSQLQQVFWARWREEYLTLLQQRTKWRSPTQSLCVNDMVLVKDENLPPMRWPLGRVLHLVPGKDGVARVADLNTASGVIRRAVNKLCLLPLKDSVERQASNGGSMSDSAAA